MCTIFVWKSPSYQSLTLLDGNHSIKIIVSDLKGIIILTGLYVKTLLNGDVMMHSQKIISQLPVILVLGFFSLLTSISGSSTNLALPKISEDLKISNGQSTWIIQIGLIVATITFVLFGHLGDMISKNFVFSNGGKVFIVGSLLTGISINFPMIMFGRVIQAIGVAMIMANSLGIVSQYFPDETRGEALSIISMFISVGAISGPAIGGIILSVSSWRWIYLFNVPLGIIIIFFSRKLLPTPKVPLEQMTTMLKRFNWLGQFIFSIGLTLFFLSGVYFQNGLNSLVTGIIFLVVGSVIALLAFYQDQKFHESLIAPELVKNWDYLLSIFILFLAMLVNAMSNILLPFYLQSYGQISPFISGLLLMGQSLTMLLITPIAGYITDHWDRANLSIIGLMILLISQIGYAMYPRTMNMVLIIIPIVINGIGLGLFLPPNNTITMSSVDDSLSGVAGSINSFARTLGVTIGISMASILLFVQLPKVQNITPKLGMSFLHAFDRVFYVAVAISAFSLIMVVWRKLRGKRI